MMGGQQVDQTLADLDVTSEQLSFFDMIPRELCPKWHPILGDGRGRTSNSQSATQTVSVTDFENLNVTRDEAQISTMLEPPSADAPRSPGSSLFQAMDAPSEQETQGYAADRLLTFNETDWMTTGDGFENVTGFYSGFVPNDGGFLQDWEGTFL
jgi:hypothetical protein